MALVTEDGTGLATAESFISVADALTLLANHGRDTLFSAATTAQQEAALRNATLYLDAKYAIQYNGQVLTNDQALSWPRTNATKTNSQTILSNLVPFEVEKAVSFIAEESFTTSLYTGNSDLIGSEAVGLGSGALSESKTYIGGKTTEFNSPSAGLALAPLLHGNINIVGRA